MSLFHQNNRTFPNSSETPKVSDKNRRLKFLFLVTEDWYFVSHRLALGKWLIAQGYEVVLACRFSNHRGKIEATGIRCLPIEFNRRTINPLREIFTVWEIFRCFYTERPDIIQNVALKPSLYGSAAAMLSNCPAWCNSINGFGYAFSSKRILPRMLSWSVELSMRLLFWTQRATILVQNKVDYAFFTEKLGIDSNRVVCIPGVGIDLKKFSPSQRDDNRVVKILFVGRIIREKGITELIEAGKLLRAKNLTFEILIAGTPDEMNRSAIPVAELEQWANSKEATLLGHRSDIAELLHEVDIVALPTYYKEGLPHALVEAAAAGLPIVTTNTPGCSDVVFDGENGFLVPTKNISALADALEKLIVSRQLRTSMGEKSRQIAETHFGRDAILSRFQQLYTAMQQTIEFSRKR